MTGLYSLAGPLLRLLDPETAHGLTIRALRLGFGPRRTAPIPPVLQTSVLGLDFPNPIGIAAGFDKNAEVPDAMLRMGFGFAETGTVTPLPQAGNPRPRIFRLSEDAAVINRLGFNNQGLDAYRNRLAARRGRPGIAGANIGANKDSTDRIADYLKCFEALAGLADYFTINVSSPNTPGLRGLQDRDQLQMLLSRLLAARVARQIAPPLLLKIAPELDDQALRDVVAVALDTGIDGLIISNTTIGGRENLRSAHRGEQGGLSGRPLFAPSTRMLREARRLSGGRLVLIGVGGIASGADAYAKIRAGASLVQLYTALTFAGPDLPVKIALELADLLHRDGFTHMDQAIGIDV
ncbi:MAG TPA: quinone-dependent dihydroorotate dehydrogenase [Alphaproteobacteria bacterium]|nr:quinone-dependent dihydroorotate dehydrogenase [Alphaproteobacteria bacterium]